MGLFSSKKKTVVSTVVSRVIKDGVLPDTIKTTLLQAIFKDEPIAESLTEGLVGSIAVKAERMYEYARTTYAHGLPGGQIKTAVEGKPEVTAVLSQIEGSPVLLVYSQYGPPNYQHIGWLKLATLHGYNPETNELAALSAIKGFPVYLDNMTVVVPEMDDYSVDALEQWGTPATAGYTPRRKHSGLVGYLRAATPVVEDPLALVPHVRIDYLWEGPANVYIDGMFTATPVVFEGSFTIPVDDYDEEASYFHAKYTVDGGASKFWMYQDGAGTYPVLDDLFVQEMQTNGTFFPFAYFRYNKTSEIADKTTQAYKTSKKLVKYLGMDYDQVATAIDENPDIDDVEQAMLVMAVPANTTNALELRYLYAFFDNLFYADANQFASPVHAGIAAFQQAVAGSDISKSSIMIQDSRFKMALSNSGIFKKRVAGSVGAVGSHAMVMEEVMVEQEYLSAGETNARVEIQYIPIKIHVYRYQVSPQFYEEIKVVNLKMLYHVWENYTVTADDIDDILLIPLDHSITSTYAMPDREELYSRSLHYVFNSRVIVTIKWYQQTWFQFVMIVVSVVVTMLSFGAAGGPMATLMGALATGTSAAISAALMAVVIQLVQGLVIGLVFKLFVKAVGPELGILLAVIAVVVSGYMAFEAGSVAGAPWAAELMQLGNSLARGVQDALGDMMKDLLAEYQTLELFKDEATKELEAANKLLEHDNWLSPVVIFGESPNDFYNRTVHSGNIGIQSISAISSYVDIALTLPKLDDTIER